MSIFTLTLTKQGHFMIDFVLNIFSTVLQMDMRDHHEIPFALPLMMAAVTGIIVGFSILKFIGNEEKAETEASTENLEN
jgi:hypothetical protein